ncbi:hypothetical protein [Salinibacterium sp. TMP30]|uniref:hypothetical protein n=1 Tax=Salinibacterium sp. TMP30 TaxID=3138237 RepID=UPI003138C07B
MRIPDSVAIAYEEALAVATPLRTLASKRLRLICAKNNWLFDDRIKSEESCLSKLEMGGGPLKDLPDLYAATIVVPTQNELDAAVSELSKSFEGTLKPMRLKSAEEFIYDDIHMLAHLGLKVSPAAVSSPIRSRIFEIQVRTGLQYAWWRATHDQVYKSATDEGHGWGVRRVSGQAKASLELLDNVLADLEKAGQQQRPGPQPSNPKLESREWLRRWSPSRRPTDAHRFATTADSLLSACGVSSTSVETAFESADIACLVNDSDVTPGQVVLAAVHSLIGADLGARLVAANKCVLVTSELVNLYPAISELPAAAVVRP